MRQIHVRKINHRNTTVCGVVYSEKSESNKVRDYNGPDVTCDICKKVR